MPIINRDPGDETHYRKCNCGKETVPGEDQCYECLGEPEPVLAEVGTEEWKKEMRENWDVIFPPGSHGWR